MSHELAKSYDATTIQSEITARWDESRAWHTEVDPSKPPFVIVIPPPNVTAALHLGHALNNTVQDILVRWRRMSGDNAVWIPGTDHAGIATQSVVEKRLQREGKRRTDFTREQFIEIVQKWKDEYEAKIIGQLKAMGCSCDWDRTAFTMDEARSKAVREAFFRLFKDGLIYRGKRLVNWDPVTQTALADDEVENEEVDGFFYYLKYPVVDSTGTPFTPSPAVPGGRGQGEGTSDAQFVTVATTRPETMLGDTAVAINPKDPRAASLRGKFVRLPIVGRIVPIIEDDYVVLPVANGGDPTDPKAQFSSGFLKVTPAHDENDYKLGEKYKLPIINVMAADASISKDFGWTDFESTGANRSKEERDEIAALMGQSREAARARVVEYFKKSGLLESTKPYRHSVGHSYRSHVPIEPYLSDQWYVAVRKQIPSLPDDGLCEGTDLPKNSLAGLAWTALSGGIEKSGGTGISGGTGVPPVSVRGFTEYRRNLPHWEGPGSTYFITFRVKSGSLTESEQTIVLNALKHWHEKRLKLHIATVMPDHVHALFTPLKDEHGNDYRLPDLLHSIKSFSAHEINKLRNSTGTVWLDEFFDRIVRDEKEYEEKWNYIFNNPVKVGLADDGDGYPFTFIGGDLAAGNTGGTPVPPETVPPEKTALKFVPERYAKTYENWNANLRDWCISRQLWWGHRIPVWSRKKWDGENYTNPAVKAYFKKHIVMPACNDDESKSDRIMDSMEFIYTDLHLHLCFKSFEAEQLLAPTVTKMDYVQDNDVLDTWFSSALWPLSTLGWPENTNELSRWNPTSTLCTAREIITLWVSRMVMFNRYLMESAETPNSECRTPNADPHLPFNDVFIHAMIQDGHGQKMSKSLGNGVDPLDIIESHGADAMRFTLCHMTTQTQDLRLPVDCIDPNSGETITPKFFTNKDGYLVASPIQEHKGKKFASSYGAITAEAPSDLPVAKNTSSKFDLGRNFANKLWNASRFVLMQIQLPVASGQWPTNSSVDESTWTVIDRWILSRLARTVQACDEALKAYRFDQYAKACYDFVWRDFCDWYLEASKPAMRDEKRKASTASILATCLDYSLRLMHPAMPFITEKLWDALQSLDAPRGVDDRFPTPSKKSLIMLAAFPKFDERMDTLTSGGAERVVERLQEIIGATRELRNTLKVDQKKKLPITIQCPDEIAHHLTNNKEFIETMALVILEEASSNAKEPAGAAKTTAAGATIFLAGAVDSATSEKRIGELKKTIASLEGRLSNESYIAKAPPKLVAETKEQLENAKAELAKLGG